MSDAAVQPHWKTVEIDLRRARAASGLPDNAAPLFFEFLNQNELELAHDLLQRSAPPDAPAEFWQNLARAGSAMGIARSYPPTHWPSVTAGRIQTLLRRTLIATSPHLQPEAQMDIVPGSIAASEIATDSERGPAGPWTHRTFRTAYVPAHMAAQMILEICVTMDLLLDLPPLLCWPYEVLTRSAVEASGVVEWLMTTGIAPRRRVVRGMLLQWASALAQERTLHEMDLDDSGHLYGPTPDSLRVKFADMGIGEPRGKGSGPVHFESEGERLPGFTARAKAALGDRAAAYSLYSLVAHA
jgi:hypothetical protein